ncbi:MAG: hypothetical protein HW400_68 [Candidatus Levybacteria bacterium]|nr:hypothetical protein [Candidatus Levybacteria bacterium]
MLESKNSPRQELASEERNRRIGNYNLSVLLKNPPEEQPTAKFDFIALTTQGLAYSRLPSLLTKQLELESLTWTAKGLATNSLAILLIGKRNIDSSVMTNNVDDANATIEIARRMKFIGKIAIPAPIFLRISGIDKEQNRIVAATYDLEDNNRLTEINVSVPYDEYIDHLKDSTKLSDIREIIATIPTNMGDLYATAGLITQAMRNELVTAKNKFPHNQALIIKLDKDYLISQKLVDAGYYVERKDRAVAIGLKEQAGKIKGLPHWKISLPSILPKP